MSKPAIPSPEEIEAIAMLLGEPSMICSCCLGRQTVKGIFGGQRRCGQCMGSGFDILGPRTAEACGLKQKSDWWVGK